MSKGGRRMPQTTQTKSPSLTVALQPKQRCISVHHLSDQHDAHSEAHTWCVQQTLHYKHFTFFFSFWSCINYIFQNVFVQGVFNKRWQTSSDLWSLVIVFTKLSFLPSKISLFGHTLVAFVSQSNHTTTSHLPKTNTMHAKAGLSSEVDARPFNAIVWPQNDS